MAKLKVLRGAQAGTQFELRADGSCIGADAGCDIVLEGPEIAPRHAELRCESGRWEVRDVSGGAGTYVRGECAADWTALGPGEHVRIGPSYVVVDDETSAESQRRNAPAGPKSAPPKTLSPRLLVPRPGGKGPVTGAISLPSGASSAVASVAVAEVAVAVPQAEAGPPIPNCTGVVLHARGHTGPVYRARQIAHARDVAIRVFEAPQKHVERLREAAQRAAELSHPNLVTIHEVGEHEGRSFATMEFLPGGSLADRIRTEAPDGLPWRDAVRLIRFVAAGLTHVHDAGLTHGAIRPTNVLVGRQGQPKLGAPGAEGDAKAGTGVPNFLAPEQARGERTTVASDVYSLGATLYFALSGRAPYAADDPQEVLARIAFSPPAPLEVVKPGLPIEIYVAVRAMLAGERAARPASVEEALARLPLPLDAADGPRDAVDRRRKSNLRRGVWIAAGVLAVAAILGSVVWERIHRPYHAVTEAEETAAGMSAAAKRFAELLAKEKTLGDLGPENLAAYQSICDECGRLASSTSIDDPVVPDIWRHRRELVRSIRGLTADDREAANLVDIWISELAAAANELVATGAGPGDPRDIAVLMTSRAGVMAQAELDIDEGRVREGLGRMSAWIITERALAKRRKASEAEWNEISVATEWLRATALTLAIRLRADLVTDVEILRAHLAETQCLGGTQATVTAPDFKLARTRLEKIAGLLETKPVRDRAARRRDAVARQEAALAAVYAAAPLKPDRDADDPWRAALIRSLDAAIERIGPEHRAGAVGVLVEMHETARAKAAMERAGSMPSELREAAAAELDALEDFGHASSLRDSVRRKKELDAWVARHAWSDASFVLAALPAAGDVRERHPVVAEDEARRWVEAWGAPPASAGR